MKDNHETDFLFFDESRFGTHSKLGHGWFKKGSRTPVDVKLGFKNFYLYGAVNPISGKHFELILPQVNTVCMNIFLQDLIKEFGNRKMTLVIDGAGWHKSKNLKIPPNITFLFLPPYSPELNPIERLWLYIKQHTIKNHIYSSLNTLQDTICDFLQNLQLTDVARICNLNYLAN